MTNDLHVLQPIFIRLDDHIRSDGVSGFQFIEHGSGLDRIRHDHRVHEARDGFVIDIGRTSLFIDGNDFALEGIALGLGARAAVAGRGCNQQSAYANGNTAPQEWPKNVHRLLSLIVGRSSQCRQLNN